MTTYWMRHRLIHTAIMCICLALIISLVFVAPYYQKKEDMYDSQSIYKNTSIDFVAPEPSFDQVRDLPGTNGIKDVFAFYQTDTTVTANGKSRTTTVLIADERQSLEATMFNQKRCLATSRDSYDFPVLVDNKFCQDTGAKIGDSISLSLGENSQEYQISAIYETNTLYDGGSILLQVPSAQIAAIRQQSETNGYSGMYVIASDYDACRLYMTTDYRPLGRLQNRDQFESDEQYQIHYDAIMSSAYANEITDFRIRENTLNHSTSSLGMWLSVLLTVAILIAFNITMGRRGCEKTYFTKQCLPKGQNIIPYYTLSALAETILCIVLYGLVMIVRLRRTSTIDLSAFIFPVVVIIVEIVCFLLNRSKYHTQKKVPTRTVSVAVNPAAPKTMHSPETQTSSVSTSEDLVSKNLLPHKDD